MTSRNGATPGGPMADGATADPAPGAVRMEFALPAADRQGLVASFFHLSCDAAKMDDILPADLARLLVVLEGDGCLRFDDGASDPTTPLCLLAPTQVATRFELEGPFRCLGAALTPEAWHRLTGLDAKVHGGRLYDARRFWGAAAPAFAHGLAARHPPGSDLADGFGAMADWIDMHLNPINARHARLIATVAGWIGEQLNPQVEDLFARLPYSSRQTQRLVERYFGLPPRALARKHRALRTAAMLRRDTASAAERAAIGEAFYDQSHLIRELHLFVGRTPGQLGGPGHPVLNRMLAPHEFRGLPPTGEDTLAQ